MNQSLFSLLLMIATTLGAANAMAEEAPIALDKWGRYHVNIVPYMPVMTPPKGQKVKWVPKVSLVFKVTAPESDDVILLQHYQGKAKWGPVQVCQIRSAQMIDRRGKGGIPMGYKLVVPVCQMDEKLAVSKTGTFAVEVGYKQTGAGKVHANLGRYTYQVKTYNSLWPGTLPPITAYYVDHDFRLGEAWLYRNSEGQLQLWSWFKYDREGEAAVRGGRMRCFVNDKKLTFHDSATGRTTVDYNHYPQRNKNEKVTWGLWYWWTSKIDGLTGAEWIAKNPGKYRCSLTQSGDISRELFFEVGADGAIKPAPCQGNNAKQVRTIDDEVLIKMEMKKSLDLKFDHQAFRRQGLYGRGWTGGCPL